MDDRFVGDILPDGTFGICKIHSPVGIVRLVGDDGQPKVGGMCQQCWGELSDERFFRCPKHGVNPKRAGQEGCPVDGCLGDSGEPTAAEIEGLAESYNRIWTGGPAKHQDAVDAPPAEPEIGRDRETLEGAEGAPGEVLPPDAGRVVDRPDGERPLRRSAAEPQWQDQFLDP